MATRLDRLFVLLEQGSSQVTRKAAAAELGEVQRLHPHELNNLLSKVRQFLHSSSWDTRVAAGHAVEAIVRNVNEWFPDGVTGAGTGFSPAGDTGRMTFAQFDINSIIDRGKDLLASEGNEFDDKSASCEGETGKDRVIEQRRLLNSRLGLASGSNLCGVTSEELVSNEDLLRQPAQQEDASRKRQMSDLAKPISKKVKKEVPDSNECDSEDKILDWASLEDWPLERFADELMNDLFSPCWETRHGAATGLREIVKLQGKCAGRVATASRAEMDHLNQAWLEDLSLRILCVLSLDKFGDFVSDQVVAPVRETCAQTLGSVFHIMSQENVRKCVSTVIQLLSRPEWEARHGGLLAMKYLLSVRQDMIDEILPLVFDAIFARLKDPIDDVSAVAAAALVPVKDALIKTLPHAISPTLKFLWDALLDIDDLTSSTSSILMLLSSLLTFGDVSSNGTTLDALLPRLWPFLGHSMTAVRKSVLEALLIVIRMSANVDWLQEESFRTALALIYQRSLVENDSKVSRLLCEAWHELVSRSSSDLLLPLANHFIAGCICLMMHPAKFPFDSTTTPVWVTAKHHKSAALPADEGETYDEKVFIGGYDLSESSVIREKAVLSSRMAAGKLIAVLAQHFTACAETVTPSPMECLSNLFLFHLNSKSSLQRMCIGLILQEWARYRETRSQDLEPIPKQALDRCLECLEEVVAYDEISSSFSRLQQEVRDFLGLLQHNKVTLASSDKFKAGSILTFEQIGELLTVEYPNACRQCDVKLKPMVRDALDEKSKSLSKSLAENMKYQSSMVTVTSSVLASAVIAWNLMPAKMNPLIRPLMDCIRKEENECIQDMAASHLSRLLGSCPAPAAKVVKNLVTFACSDPSRTPVVGAPVPPLQLMRSNSQIVSCSSAPSTPSTPESGSRAIIMLNNMQKVSERNGFRRSVSLSGRKSSPSEAMPLEVASEESSECSREVQVATRGASAALVEIVKFFGDSLPTRIPQLWSHFTSDVKGRPIKSMDDAQVVVQALQVIEISAKYLHNSLKSHLCDLLPHLCLFAESAFPEVRHLTSRCLAALSLIITSETMSCIIDHLLPLLASPHAEVARQGAVECIAYVIESLGLRIVPYIVLLVVPMLARMSDQCEHVRLLATHCFAQLIQLMPLDNERRTETLDRKDLLQKKNEERKFLEQLVDPKKLENFTLPIPVKAELRSYQQQGVNWLAFLNRYKLHGILCDEMGLGKTLMSICILASDHFNKKTSASYRALPSLVVCPPTLTGHWAFEVNKFVCRKHLNPLHYTGSPAERNKLKDKLKKQSAKNDPDSGQSLVVASYDIVRNDIDFFSSVTWNYCILDEGHIIKNGKTKLSKAIKSLTASHRLILTGTPIQNNVLELWSLFDFLMPGFLGTEKQFISRFSRPILQSRDAKSSSKEQEAGVLAMESLHRQVLPFILRRMKEDVLKDLPPKIMQDYYCELSPLQARLYEDFAKSHVRQNMEIDLSSGASGEAAKKGEPKVASHIFQALQYLRKVCNHPKLVLSPQHPEFSKITSQLQQQHSSLSDVNHATKLCALKQLLLDCGIGTQNLSSSGNLTVVNQHRALIFCQLKSMLDIVEQDLLKSHMPSVSYLRLDGSIPPGSRHSVVHRFNNDPSIDVLLLTTQVGGLGLNLTGADTVIFVEHDWNPMKDLQAMDRAHRIGQKKVVNVYRLVTTGTLEEKIMSLQKFKLTIANTVISHENASLQTMATDQLLDLFTLDPSRAGVGRSDERSGASARGVRSVLESLPDLWEESAYESEYDLTNFIKSLR